MTVSLAPGSNFCVTTWNMTEVYYDYLKSSLQDHLNSVWTVYKAWDIYNVIWSCGKRRLTLVINGVLLNV